MVPKTIIRVLLVSVIALLAGLIGCDSTPPTQSDALPHEEDLALSEMERRNTEPYPSASGSGFFTDAYHGSGHGVYSYSLWAGKHSNAGTVLITNDENDLLITVNTNGSADLSSLHVYVWPVGPVPARRPPPGAAPFKVENIDADSYTITVTAPGGLACDTEYYVSIHASLTENNTPDDESFVRSNAGESAYAAGSDLPEGFPNVRGGAWWGYVSYTVTCQQTGVDQTGSAFGYLDGNATCFRDMGLGFQHWGWSNGPVESRQGLSYSGPLLAQVDGCDPTQGVVVGSFQVWSYWSPGAPTGVIEVWIEVTSDYTLTGANVYHGTDPLPVDINGNPFVDPAEYAAMQSVWENEFFFFGFEPQTVAEGSDFYFIVHAKVEPK